MTIKQVTSEALMYMQILKYETLFPFFVFFLVPERLKHKTKMLLVVEVPEETKAVELVVRICVIQLLEKF